MGDLYYRDHRGYPLKEISLTPLSTGVFHRTRLLLRQNVFYTNPKYPIIACPPGEYNGYSIPKPITLLTLGMLQPFMPVVECTLPHDVVCDQQLLEKDQRAELFKDAYDDAVRQFYGGINPDRRRDELIAGVLVGSQVFGRC